MNLTLEQAVGQQFLVSFAGKHALPSDFLKVLQRQHLGGVVLFRAKNMGTLKELRELTSNLQRAAAAVGQPPLLICTDQEGGQLMAIGEGTPFPGNLALGATGSERLAFRVGQALGLEAAAVGVNVNFAPVCDVNNNPDNPVVGTRSFGEDPQQVALLSAAMVRGLQASGVAASAKHFPGHGDTTSDSHHGAPVIPHSMRRICRVELPPFIAAIEAGTRMIMTAHIVLPALGHGRDLPATLSREILHNLLRKKLGYNGLIVTDALDMGAIDQGAGLAAETIAALAAGADLLLFNHDLSRQEPVYGAILQAVRRGLLLETEVRASAKRILALKRWLKTKTQPPLETVGCNQHQALAREVAQKSITLVRDAARRLPLELAAHARVAVVVPRPKDLTPADTSSYQIPALAAAVRRLHRNVEEILYDINPSHRELRSLRNKLRDCDLAIVGTINASAHPGQALLVNELLSQGTATIAVALRMPYDLLAYPRVQTFVCTYSILPPSMEAVADALWGRIPFVGQLPVSLPYRR